MADSTCATCPWWYGFPEKVEFRWDPATDTQAEVRTPNEKGECRKQPPRPPREFPTTAREDWCGKHPERRLPRDSG